ncbi:MULTISPECIES: pantoate--beta-alanine ligase [Thermus]|uniref:Pantothenate synthetase n=3 Tax=Thermus thermophilus TaxID=274 RepID=PANC_THET8|nr:MULTISPECIES: pantoate--beta-alanine ligase [Thermus]Q5SHF5.1 RecName: Full=Pantothenate synthetase; Short=PS; AltName: Full=Pantoate--beta-alanine ligase; AltName: Full=Pantoate-activating enzyme [Thermus thermophilus HB8]Q72HS0.1 RecName: Full=Pantothenate synthetase; Short=PS; AltName: Full=Pantoate--beta-alanine ligase; AltName: Full=Pantoate-activating enzyme [Thermus thermophilus HB27]1V8F_A Chain A, Pantoate-beta-alanine ligase [Thermus thermophilus]1V8F_B Chain B, Pantoate-beta-alani
MRTVSTVAELRAALPREGVGFVPTMGYLHRGHLALVERARRENPFVVVSVFVNPLQFGPGEDYHRYPRDLERDRALLQEAGVDLLFAPGVEEMYPEGFATRVQVEGPLTALWEGAVRPGHFQGVATVVARLFLLVQPQRAYFGEKDYQQLLVVRRMVRDLGFPVEVVGVPTVREEDGLALSSRNVYLSPETRKKAPVLYRALLAMREVAGQGGSVAEALRAGEEALRAVPEFRKDYLAIVHPETLLPLSDWVAGARGIVAGRFPEARLIDNLEVYP